MQWMPSSAVETQSLNHWTIREFPNIFYFWWDCCHWCRNSVRIFSRQKRFIPLTTRKLVKLSFLTPAPRDGPLKGAPPGAMVSWVGRVLGQVVWTEWENYRRPLGESDALQVRAAHGWGWLDSSFHPFRANLLFFHKGSQFIWYTSPVWSYKG